MFKFLRKLFTKNARAPFPVKGKVDQYLGAIRYMGPMGIFFNGDTMDLYRLSTGKLLTTIHLPVDEKTQLTSIRKWKEEEESRYKKSFRIPVRPIVEIKTDPSRCRLGFDVGVVADEFEGTTTILLKLRECLVKMTPGAAKELISLLNQTLEKLEIERKEKEANEG